MIIQIADLWNVEVFIKGDKIHVMKGISDTGDDHIKVVSPSVSLRVTHSKCDTGDDQI
jgi:hypothetical protein